MARSRITIVGAGNVGQTTGHLAATKRLGDVVLIDIVPKLAEGKALDIAEASPIGLYDAKITGTTDWTAAADSDIVIITSGVPRKPGMSRDDLLATNTQIVKGVCGNIARYCPDSVVIVVCNPLDAMTHAAAKVTGFAPKRIVGMAGALDSARFCYFVACELSVSVEDVKCVLMGGHGDDMVPLPRFTSVGGIPITELLDEKRITELVSRTRNGGIEIVNLLGTSAYYAPAAGAVRMADAVLQDKKSLVCCCAYCDHQYNAGGLFVGVPVILGSNGVEEVLELALNPFEQAELEKSIAHVRELAASVDKLLQSGTGP